MWGGGQVKNLVAEVAQGMTEADCARTSGEASWSRWVWVR